MRHTEASSSNTEEATSETLTVPSIQRDHGRDASQGTGRTAIASRKGWGDDDLYARLAGALRPDHHEALAGGLPLADRRWY